MMRSSTLVRFGCLAAVALALIGGAAVSAQDATPQATADALTLRMVQAACPQSAASIMAMNMMSMTETPPMEATAAATMEATEMATTEATEVTMPEATEAATMEGTEAALLEATEAPTPVKMMSLICLFGEFSGSAEVPGPGASGATGVAFVGIDPVAGEICYEVAVANLTLPAAKMHIHKAEAGVSGDVVVPFDNVPGADGTASGCTSADSLLANDIATNPASYYVNVHTSDFPNGAARAQLAVWDEDAVLKFGAMMTPMAPGLASATPEATASS